MKIATMTVKSNRDKRHMSVYIRRQNRKQKQVKKPLLEIFDTQITLINYFIGLPL